MGPKVEGMEQIPCKDPTAWDAPLGPQILKAIGLWVVMKHPSKRPIINARQIMNSNSNPVSFGATKSNVAQVPSIIHDTCWSKILFTIGMSKTLPNMTLPIPEVAATQISKVSAFSSGRISFTNGTWKITTNEWWVEHHFNEKRLDSIIILITLNWHERVLSVLKCKFRFD